MEKWAKTLNQKKEKAKNAHQAMMNSSQGEFGNAKSAGAADACFAILDKQQAAQQQVEQSAEQQPPALNIPSHDSAKVSSP